jgi:hypothetical protein
MSPTIAILPKRQGGWVEAQAEAEEEEEEEEASDCQSR